MDSCCDQMLQQASLPAYHYSALPEGRWIRVAVIRPYTAHVDELLYIEFEHVCIDDREHKPYAAISYAWEGSTLRDPVICENSILRVTPQLMSALRDIRQSKDNVAVWADAMCIDQSDEGLPERQRQVSIMNHIFAQASQVLVYLGKLEARDRDTVAMIDKFSTMDFSNLDVTTYRSLAAAHAYVMDAVKDHSLPTAHSDIWDGLRMLLEKPWFIRLWIVQEYAVAQKVLFLFGTNELMEADKFRSGLLTAVWYYSFLAFPMLERLLSKGFTAVETVMLWLPHHSRQQGFHFPIFQLQQLLVNVTTLREATVRFGEITTFRSQYQAQKPRTIPLTTCSITQLGSDFMGPLTFGSPWWKFQKHSFFENYIRTRRFAATDTRDRVYALLGLCSEKGISALRVDYRITPRTLSERISLHLINRGHAVYMVTSMSLSSMRGKHGWRVLLCENQFSKTEKLCKLLEPSGRFHRNLFLAGGYEENVQVLSGTDVPRIAVDGICVAHVETICPIELPEMVLQLLQGGTFYHQSLSWWAGMKNQIKWYNQAVVWLKEVETWIRAYKHQSESLELECWRTLCCGMTFSATAERELIASRPDQFDPALAIMQCKQAYSSVWNFFWRFRDQNVAIPWDHLATSLDMLLSVDSSGRLCSIPVGSKVGDLICILKGFPLPFILRPTDNNTYLVIGACYVKGVMDGDYFAAVYPVDPMSFVLESGPDIDDE